MSIRELSDRDFELAGKTLRVKVPGALLVFFKMVNCLGCNSFSRVFYDLAAVENRVSFAVLDVGKNRQVVAMSRKSSTSIQNVPYILLYINGIPQASYKGEKSIPSITSFIGKFTNNIPRNFMPPKAQGIYGSGGYSHPQIDPREYQTERGGKSWMPEIGKAPTLQGIIKGNNSSQYAYLNDVEEDDDEKLMLPHQVTPHNVPWESNYKRLGTLD